MKHQLKGQFLKNSQGQIMIMSIIFLAIILIISATIFSKVTNLLHFGSISIEKEQATALAEAGIDKAVMELNETAGAYSGETLTLGTTGQFTTTIQTKTPSLKTITSTGYIPNATSPKVKRTIKIDVQIDNTIIEFHYAVQTGEGGLEMNNNAVINGGVFTNGSITNINGNGSVIYGDAYAVGTISNPPLVTGNKLEFQELQDMPPMDYNYWRTAANINNDAITCSPTCTISTTTEIGPQQYNGNLEITGNPTVTINGPIYVTGDFTISLGGTTVKLNDNFGSDSTVFMVDGKVSYTQGGEFQPTNANPKGYLFVVTSSTALDAITIAQSGATAVFYALDGGAMLSQTADVTAIVADSLNMSQSATLNFDPSLTISTLTAGPGGSWQIKRGTYKFTKSP